MVKHELQVTSYELRIESLKERVENQKFELKSTSYEFNFTSYELKSTSSRITKSMKTQLNRHRALHILISSVKLLGSPPGYSYVQFLMLICCFTIHGSGFRKKISRE